MVLTFHLGQGLPRNCLYKNLKIHPELGVRNAPNSGMLFQTYIKTFPQNSNEFEVEAELTIHALEQGFKVGEFECLYKPRPEGSVSKLSTFKDGMKILRLILILIKDEKPLLFFSILSVFFIILSLAVGIPIIKEFYITGLVERLPSAILAGLFSVLSFLSFFCGLILDVMKKIRFENKKMNYLLFKE